MLLSRVLVGIGLAAILISPVPAPTQPAATPEATVRAIIADLFAQRETQFEAHWIPGATIVVASGSAVTLDRFFADGKPDLKEREWYTLSDVKTATYGGAAVATFSLADHEAYPDRSFVTNYKTTMTLVRQGDRWLVVALQDTLLPPGRVAIASTVLQRYVGEYKSATGDWFRLTFSAGKLFSQTVGDRHAYEMVPASATTFFTEGDPEEYVLVDDARGVVAALVQMQSLRAVTYHRVANE